ncbi:hypothetical protein B1219_09080 [Pseudomonas ogarae]|nr:hypothetical protein B1219_09080 [Pseudomonas ogarae]OPG75950.1 hypothetical protein B1218_28695 [Pseudomonas ogarae]
MIPCGSEPARDSGGSVCGDVDCDAVIASKLAPTGGEDNSQACAGSFQRLNHQRTREIGLPSASSGRPSSA